MTLPSYVQEKFTQHYLNTGDIASAHAQNNELDQPSYTELYVNNYHEGINSGTNRRVVFYLNDKDQSIEADVYATENNEIIEKIEKIQSERLFFQKRGWFQDYVCEPIANYSKEDRLKIANLISKKNFHLKIDKCPSETGNYEKIKSILIQQFYWDKPIF